jgi:ketosteroid isomerase-like protein
MKNKILPLLLLLLTAISEKGKAQKNNASQEEARAAIIASNNIYFSSFSKGDSSIFIDRYAADACIMPPNSPAVCGPGAAAKFFREAYYGFGLRDGKFTIIDIYGSGEYVTEYGLYESRDAQGNLTDEGKYLVLWKKTERGWKMFRDSFSSNRSK